MGGQAQLGGVAPAFPAVVSRQHSEKEPVSLGAALSPCLQTGGPSVPRLWHAHAPPRLCFTVIMLISLVIAATWTFLALHQPGSRTFEPHPPRAPLPLSSLRPRRPWPGLGHPAGHSDSPVGGGEGLPSQPPLLCSLSLLSLLGSGGGRGRPGEGAEGGRKEPVGSQSPPVGGQPREEGGAPGAASRVVSDPPPRPEDPTGAGAPPAAPRARTGRRLRGQRATANSLAERKKSKTSGAGGATKETRRQPFGTRGEAAGETKDSEREPEPRTLRREDRARPVTLWKRRGPSFHFIIE